MGYGEIGIYDVMYVLALTNKPSEHTTVNTATGHHVQLGTIESILRSQSQSADESPPLVFIRNHMNSM